MDPLYPFWPIAFFICFIWVLIPLPWHLNMWQVNVGLCAYIIWLAIALLNQFINSIVWKDNARNPHPIWCDISSRLIIGVSVAIPASSLCVSRCMYNIAQGMMNVSTSKARRRHVIIDLCICVGLPILVMIWFYVVQGHRFNILEEIGCMPATFNTPLAYVLVYMWPLLLGLVSMVYCCITVPMLVKLRKDLSANLGGYSSLSPSKYMRLLALASVDAVLTVPFAAYSIYANATQTKPSPWKGWANAHLDFNRVSQLPAIFWRRDPATIRALDMTRAFLIVCAGIFILFFGFSTETLREYKKISLNLAKKCGYRPKAKKTPSMSSGPGSGSGSALGPGPAPPSHWKDIELDLSAFGTSDGTGDSPKVDFSTPISHQISLGDFKMYMADGNGITTLRTPTATAISASVPASNRASRLMRHDSTISRLTSIDELTLSVEGVSRDNSSVDLSPISPTYPRPPALTTSPSLTTNALTPTTSTNSSTSSRDKPLPITPAPSRPVSALTVMPPSQSRPTSVVTSNGIAVDLHRISVSSARRDIYTNPSFPPISVRVSIPPPPSPAPGAITRMPAPLRPRGLPPVRPPRPETLGSDVLNIV